MHELGHSLGLDHGGTNDATNYKPNYLSIMSYTYQMTGVPRKDGGLYLDYSRSSVGALDESSLNEVAAFTASDSSDELQSYGMPIICLDQDPFSGECYQFATLNGYPVGGFDYSNNGCLDAMNVSADLNGLNGASDTFAATEDDWNHLDYGGGGVIGYLEQVDTVVRTVWDDTPVTCMSAQTAQAVVRAEPAVVRVGISPPPMCFDAGG